MIDIKEIRSILPHRYPFLLVDRIVELKEEEKIVGIKNVSVNEPFFQGHYPDHPIMPGVLIVEAMAQVGGILMYHSLEDTEDRIPYFAGIDKARFRKPVTPGDQLRLQIEMLRLGSRIAKVAAEAHTDRGQAAEAELLFAVQ